MRYRNIVMGLFTFCLQLAVGHISSLAADNTPDFRPEIVDRNGVTLAADIRMPSLYATPGMVLDPEAAAGQLHSVLPELDLKSLRDKLAGAG